MTNRNLYLISDLMFRSRVRETLGQQDVLFAKSLEKAREIVNTGQIETVIVDLNLQSAMDIIQALRNEFASLAIIAFGSHVLEEKLAAAKQSGASQVMANSGFVKWLEAQRSSVSQGQSGASWLSLFVFGIIVWAALWYAFHVIPIYYRYYELENAFRGISKVANDYDDKELRKRLLFQMKDIQVPGNIRDVVIERLPNSLRVQYSYGEDITFTLGEHSWLIQEFFFDLDISEEPAF